MKKKRSFGFGFPDEVSKVDLKSSHFKRWSNPDWVDALLPNFHAPNNEVVNISFWRTTAFSAICLIIFFMLFLRLFHLQIVEGQHSSELSDGNRIQIRLIYAPRGVIFDRNGRVLAANAPAFRLVDRQTQKIKLISREEALELEVKNDPKASDLEVDNVRIYPLGEKVSHVVGYVGEISSDQLGFPQFKDYQIGDRVGKTGLEAQYENFLRGDNGGEIIEVDSMGRKLQTLRKNPAIPGQNIYLNIDADLQENLYQKVEEGLLRSGSCCGAAIAMDPQNGEVLALASFPSFDPDIFILGDDSLVNEIFTQADSPILNRVIGGSYPPGSTFKIVSALAGLTEAKITKDTIIQDSGVIYLGSFKFSNWYFNQYGKTEGPLNLIRALKRSNDIYFYQVGQMVGEKVLGDWAKRLKLGKKMEIDLPGEIEGLIPDDGWKQKTLGQIWYPGDTLHMAIGQGFVLTTPLQILGITSYIAAGGSLYKPQLVSKVVDGNRVVKRYIPQILVSNLTSQDHILSIKEGLVEVAQPGGTAWPFFTFPIPTAGKTGTAEFGDPKGRTHAWYTSFAPAEDPKIAMTILLEASGEGSSVAAPIAKEVYRWYLSDDKNKLIQDIGNK